MVRRVRAVGCAVVLVPLGLVARFTLPGLLGDGVGGTAYAALLYLLVVIGWPRQGRPAVASIALGVGIAVELVQLTGLPATLAVAFPPARLVLGSTFAVVDLVWVVAGVASAWLLDRALLAPDRRDVRRSPGIAEEVEG